MIATMKRQGLKLALLGLVAGLGVLGGAAPGEAVVYCKTVGVPKGCVVRNPPVHVIYCTRPGYPRGCVIR